MTVHIAESESDLRKIAGVMRELRPAFDGDGLVARIKEQMAQAYRVAYVEEDGGSHHFSITDLSADSRKARR